MAELSADDAQLCEEFVRSAQWLLERTETVGRRHTLPITTAGRVSETAAACLEEHYLREGWRRCTIFARTPALAGAPPGAWSPPPRQEHAYWLNLER
jgi:hypothetical protein